ncbi:MAG TPA: HAD hydrolase-like protein [Motilibacteraceae bacterium]|nr:HAD hydrolase-like protein [Motilibacteraceae bacterium]
MPPVAGHDLLLLDLDGTVYVAPEVIPTAPAALEQARAAGARLLFLTNNALRTPEQTAELLSGLGVPAAADEVVTSAQAAAGLLAADLPAGSPVLVVGGEGLRRAVADVGLLPVDEAADGPVAVVQGYAPTVDWALLSEGALAVRAGARWMATNLDLTLPSPRGQLVGNGALVAAVRAATGVEPEVAGKPERHLVDAALARLAPGTARSATGPTARSAAAPGGLVVGDRLDTDIACAHRAGLPSLLVLTGVSRVPELLTARREERPSLVGRDLSALHVPHPTVLLEEGGSARCGGWRAQVVDGRLTVEPVGDAVVAQDDPAGEDGTDGLDPLRAAAVVAWAAADAGRPADLAGAAARLTELTGT